MTVRKITVKKYKQYGGGTPVLGIDVKSISTFNPNSIPDLVLWIKANEYSLVYSTISSYIKLQSITIQERLTEQFKNILDATIISEIKSISKSTPNSLERYELEPAEGFPILVKKDNDFDVISMIGQPDLSNNLVNFKLVTTTPIKLDPKFSMWTISKNIIFKNNQLLRSITLQVDPDGYKKDPVAEFSEIIVYSRTLKPSEIQKVEGYIAYLKNEQYLLAVGHPYLPDMSYLPVLKEFISNIDDQRIALENTLENYNKILDEYRELYDKNDLYLNESINRGRITQGLFELSNIMDRISKGALLALKKHSLKEPNFQIILNCSNELFGKVETAESLNSTFQKMTSLIAEINSYLDSIKALGPKELVQEEPLPQIGGAPADTAIASAHSQEILEETQREVSAREFYQTLRQKSNQLNILGKSLYGPMSLELQNKLSVFWESADHTNKSIQADWRSVIADFNDISGQIGSKAWLKYVPTLDISEADVTPDSISYRNSHLNTVQSLYEKIRNQLYSGDMAYIKMAVNHKAKELEKINTAALNKTIHATCKKTFIPHCKQRYYEIDAYMDIFTQILGPIQEGIRLIQNSLKWSKANKTVSPLDTVPVIPTQERFRSDCESIYVRKVNRADSDLTGIDYIVTDSNGDVQMIPNKDGDLDCRYIFPSFEGLKISEEDKAFLLYWPYRSNGIMVNQQYIILDPLPSHTIIDSLSSIRRPNYWFHSIGDSTIFEIDREECGIHQFVAESSAPIQLPKYAMDPGTNFIIQNVGALPIHVQIPGFPTDFLDMIGTGETNHYIYSDYTEGSGGTFYGRCFWRDGYLPYDTVLNCPRSAFSVFVPELNTEIYVKSTLEPICDSEGYFIKVHADSGGKVYDIDDVYLANPYTVNNQSQLHLSELKLENRKALKMAVRMEDPAIWVIQDMKTSLPMLCNEKGVPATNEFGYTKFIKTPLTHINGTTVVRGAFTDLTVQLITNKSVEQSGILEPFVMFEAVYRSAFVKEKSGTPDLASSYIFMTSTGYAIISPNNMCINSEATLTANDSTLVYKDMLDISGTKQPVGKYAYLLTDTIPLPPLSVGVLPYISVQGTVKQSEMKKICRIILNRYVTNKSYILDCIADITTAHNEIAELGESQSEDILSSLKTVQEEIQANLDKYNTYMPIVETIKKDMNSVLITDQVKVSIDMLDLKMKELLTLTWKSFNTVDDSIEFYINLSNDIKSVKETTMLLREVTFVDIDQRIGTVHGIIQNDSQVNKRTISADLDRPVKVMIQAKQEYESKLVTLETAIKTLPSLSTQIKPWIQDKKSQIAILYGIYNKIKNIALSEIPRVLEGRSNILRSNYLKEIRSISVQFDTYVNYRNAMKLWMGIPETEGLLEYEKAPPILNSSNVSAVKGLSIELTIFEELMNPSVNRDWKAVAESRNNDPIAQRIQNELVVPIEAIKKSPTIYSFIGYKNISIMDEIEKVRGFGTDGMLMYLNNSKMNMQQMTSVYIAFEKDIEPVLKSYDSIRAELRAELKTKLSSAVKTIHERWLKATGKQTAIQTTLEAMSASLTPDQQTIKTTILSKLDRAFNPDVEASIQGLLQGYTTPAKYDSMKYFVLKAEHEKQIAGINALDKLDIEVDMANSELEALPQPAQPAQPSLNS